MKSTKKVDSRPKSNHRKSRQKLTLSFNEEKRKNFLGGFHKRKLERQKRAQEELKHQLKLEKKKIKKDAQEKYKKMLSFRQVPELEEFNKEEFEIDGRQVSILELDIADLVKRTESIGANSVSYEDNSDAQGASGASEDTKGAKVKNPKSGDNSTKNIKMNNKQKPKKVLQQAVKKSTMKIIQNSKAFRTQKILSRNKNKKDARRKKRFLEECKSKNKRHKK
ncbi:hypothetical protein QAD02_019453 [Eretmocerus hayati]|uniref:Uncharacterized protein n=1 Tax=Eretmocerus hayati TaxID=131215 RepID=A0ACC2PJP3_9HYME|nr:hypothetical protein QAD02_019453 [Eretmocerus hayati]